MQSFATVLPLINSRCAGVVPNAVIGSLEVLSDRDGAVVFGWVAEGVLYAQMIERLSTPLGMRYAHRLEAQFQKGTPVRLFLDCSGLDNYELPARNAVARVLVSQRKLLTGALVLARARVVELGVQFMATRLAGLMEVTRDRAEFVASLDRAAPYARRYVQNPVSWIQAANSVPP